MRPTSQAIDSGHYSYCRF